MDRSRVRLLAEAALTLALALVLRRLSLFTMPLGGSFSLEMLPIFIFALRRGPAWGIAVGALFGVLDVMFEPAGSIVHWAQFFLDFPVAFGLLGLAGLFRPVVARGGRSMAAGVVAGCVLGGTARFLAHFVSGAIFFATTAMGGPLKDGVSAFSNPAALVAAGAYSAAYNLWYMLPTAIACAALALVIVPVLERAVPVPRMKTA